MTATAVVANRCVACAHLLIDYCGQHRRLPAARCISADGDRIGPWLVVQREAVSRGRGTQAGTKDAAIAALD